MSTKIPRRKVQRGAPSPNIRKKPPNVNAQKAAPNAVPAQAVAPPPKAAPPAPVLRTRRPLPAKSLQNAANAFKNFSLSRFAKASTPANYVPAAKAKLPSAVAAVQRKAMAGQAATLADKGPTGPGLGLALPSAQIAALLPSLDAKAGTVDSTELLNVLKQRLRGTELYAAGNPTLNRVVRDSQLLSQVQALIAAIKAGGA